MKFTSQLIVIGFFLVIVGIFSIKAITSIQSYIDGEQNRIDNVFNRIMENK